MKVTLKGNKALIRELKNLAHKATVAASEEIEATAVDIDARAVNRLNSYVDTGRLKGAQGFEVKGLHAVNFNSAEYSGYMEFGTKTKVNVPPEMQEEADKFRNGKGSYEQFKENISEWMQRKGIPQEALYPIMAKILRIGISPRPFMYNSFKEGTKGLEKRIDKAIQDQLDKL